MNFGEEWIGDDDEIIRCYFPFVSAKKLITLLPNRTESAIQNRAFALGVKTVSRRTKNVEPIPANKRGPRSERNELQYQRYKDRVEKSRRRAEILQRYLLE